MSVQNPSTPLNAQDAKAITDDAIIQLKKVATDAWLVTASTQITAAAKAGNYQTNLVYDSTVNLQEIVKQLQIVLGYTTTVMSPTSLAVDWRSVERSQITPPNNPDSNFGYAAN